MKQRINRSGKARPAVGSKSIETDTIGSGDLLNKAKNETKRKDVSLRGDKKVWSGILTKGNKGIFVMSFLVINVD